MENEGNLHSAVKLCGHVSVGIWLMIALLLRQIEFRDPFPVFLSSFHVSEHRLVHNEHCGENKTLQKASVLFIAHSWVCVAAEYLFTAADSKVRKSLCAFTRAVVASLRGSARIWWLLMFFLLLHILTGPLLHTDPRFIREIVWYKLTTHLIPPLTADSDHNITRYQFNIVQISLALKREREIAPI